MYHYGPSNFGLTFVKKGSPERVKLLLRLMDFLAAPFGSTESTLLLYGVQGVDYSFDADGTPLVTNQGRAEITVPWKYITANPSVLFDPARSQEFATFSQEDERAMVAVGINDPTLGLFSAANTSKSALLNSTIYSGISEIVTGTRPLTDLDTLVREWRETGGSQMKTEFEAALAAK